MTDDLAREPASIAVLNAGSSSLKFALYGANERQDLMFRGQIERISSSPRLKVVDANGTTVDEREWRQGELDHDGATREVLATGRRLLGDMPVRAVGHRVVHGGMRFSAPTFVDAAILDELEQFVPLAPLHQPHNLRPIRVIAEALPTLPQIACFDTAFHRSQPVLAQSFALPRALTEGGVRRYGFHGLSYEFIASRLRELAPELARRRLIIAHLGNGASLCAALDGRSVASTMGFTAVDGLMMGTRSGAIDPGVILYLMDQKGLSTRDVEALLYTQSGLLGVSGISSDMRTLRASDRQEAREAIDLFVYRIVREIGSLAASLGGLDGLVFTGGIGENDVQTRAEVVAQCRWLGFELDAKRNETGQQLISTAQSAGTVLVIATDEERMIARHTMDLLSDTGAPSSQLT
ncbi:acetate/propionate family kinase [Reyranella sp.]|uniref:acetate/propionate family kinase n=1 Tax=Reyranella sp. TaxID=1929291 RepID=UPI003D104983